MRYQRAAQPLKLDGPEAARAFFAGCFAESDPARECLWVAHVDRQLNCIHLSRHEGDAHSAGLPLKTVVADAALHDSAGLILAQNHPSGDCRPSRADCLETRRLATAVEALDCTVVDHFVFGAADFSSFRQLGLL